MEKGPHKTSDVYNTEIINPDKEYIKYPLGD